MAAASVAADDAEEKWGCGHFLVSSIRRNYPRVRHREEFLRRSNPFFLCAARWIASLRSQ
jgi:hypothetical protein